MQVGRRGRRDAPRKDEGDRARGAKDCGEQVILAQPQHALAVDALHPRAHRNVLIGGWALDGADDRQGTIPRQPEAEAKRPRTERRTDERRAQAGRRRCHWRANGATAVL